MDNDRFQSSFSDMLRDYPQAIEERRKLVGLMRDLFPEDQMRVNLIIVAYDLGIAEEIAKAPSIDSSVITRYGKQMVQGHGISSENAEWAAAIWCVCYGSDVLGKALDPDVVVPSFDKQNQARTQLSAKAEAVDRERAQKLIAALNDIGILAEVVRISHGPESTYFDLKSELGIKANKISSQSEYIANCMGVQSIRVLPSKAIGAFACITVPNDDIEEVLLTNLLDVDVLKNNPSPTAVALGVDDAGDCVVIDVAEMHHILLVGQTGSGKTACINSIVTSLIHRSYPEEVRLLLIDPRGVELYIYNNAPHLVCPVVTEPKKALSALDWTVAEMTKRYKMFAERGVRDIRGYNHALKLGEQEMPQMVIVIEELADLMAFSAKETTEAINMLTLRSSNAGIHLIISTNRTSGRILVKDIRDNMPCRLAFALPSANDSRTVINASGAEKLRGRGDLLLKHIGRDIPLHVWSAWISDDDIRTMIASGKASETASYDPDIIDHMIGTTPSVAPNETYADEYDPRLPEAVDIVMDLGQASVSMIQRRMRIGYARSGRLIDEMARLGIVSEAEGALPRTVLVSREHAHRILDGDSDYYVPSSQSHHSSPQNQEAQKMQAEIDRLRGEFSQAKSEVRRHGLTAQTKAQIDHAQGILDGLQDGVDKANTALRRHEEYQRRQEEQKQQRIEEARKGSTAETYEIDMVVSLLNEEALGLQDRNDTEFAKVYAEDFPLYSVQEIIHLRRKTMPIIHDARVMEMVKANMLSRTVQKRFSISTSNHFAVDRDWDLDRRCRTAIEDTKMWYREYELSQLPAMLEERKAKARSSVIEQLDGLRKGWSVFASAKRDLRVKIKTSTESIPATNTLFHVELRAGVQVELQLANAALGYLVVPVMNVFAYVWGVTPEEVWQAATRNPIDDDRGPKEHSLADALVAKRRALSMLKDNDAPLPNANEVSEPSVHLRFQKLDLENGHSIDVVGNLITLNISTVHSDDPKMLIFHANDIEDMAIKTPRLFSRSAFLRFEFAKKTDFKGILSDELDLLRKELKWLKGTVLTIPYSSKDKDTAMSFMCKIAEDLDLELEEL